MTKEATTTQKGEKTYVCTVCGATKTEKIPMLTDTPQTGDNSNMMLWIALLFVSCGGVIGMIVYGKRKREI